MKTQQSRPAATARARQAAATVAEVRFEHRRETLGLGAGEPRLSWVVETPAAGWRQAAYEIDAVGADGQVRGGTGRVESGQSVLVAWPFAPLRSRERLSVRVRVWGTDGAASAWSAPYPAEAGLLSPADWTARFVAPGWEEDTGAPQPAPMLRREFDVRSGVAAARLYVTALGVYEAQINGETVGDHVLDPGWTSYNHRLRYYTFDVTRLLREGRNVIGAILADGWYRGRLGFGGGRRNIYGDRLALLAQLEISYADGTTERVVTDESWRVATGPILAGDIYDGETYDARLERPGWSAPGYDDAGWSPVVPLERDPGTLVAPTGPPVRRTEIITPVSIGKSPSGRTLVDFGQNLVGRLRIAVQGEAGTTITLRHAEVLENGELGVRPLRTAQATDRYTLRGGDPETWEPRFTFHGFRYAEVDGWPGEVMGSGQEAGDEGTGSRGQGTRSESQEPGAAQQSAHDGVVRVQASGAPETALFPAPLSPAPSSLSTQHSALSVSAIVTHSDMERTGWFECSDPLVNRLHENVVWSMRGNFLDIPTDCPQRDERLGWTGDLAAFAPTATFLYDCAGFLQSWLADLAAEQKAGGGLVPQVIPNVLEGMTFAAAAWGDAAAIVPWVLYQRFGDGGLLAAQYESMRSWVDLVAGLAGENRLWDEGFQFGDWLDPSAPPEQPWAGRTSADLVATAYFARSAELVSLAADVLGRHEDAARYKNLAAEVRAAFAGAYLQADGLMSSDSETAYSLAVEYGLLPTEEQRRRAGERLAELARESDYAISTGFVGTPIVCDALCSVGEMDAAYRLLMRRECPSWLYPVTMGGTTIWERWDSMRPDGTINPGEMTSFNHYALGAVADWLHRVVGGLAPAAPGYRVLEVRPQPGGGLTHARARHRTPYGIAECSWRIADGQIEVEVVVPPNTSAIVELPGSLAEPIEVGSGKHSWSYRYGSETEE